MAEKKYYWLKLKEDFFNDKEIKKLRKIAGGDTYTIIYLKMLLLGLKTGGKLYYDGVEDTFSEELALELDEDIENVKLTILYLLKRGMIEEVKDDELLLTRMSECIGSETKKAETMRRKRLKTKESYPQYPQNSNIFPEVLPPVTNSLPSVTNTLPYIDIDIDKEIEKEKKIEIEIDRDSYLTDESTKMIGHITYDVKKEIISVWNSQECTRNINDIRALSKREDDTRLCIGSDYGLFINTIKSIDSQPFFQQQKKSGSSVKYDWFVEPKNYDKVVEGNYSEVHYEIKKQEKSIANEWLANV